MRAPPSELPTIAADLLDRLRARRPRVHCVTNAVAQAFTANVLLAAGAVPSMTIAPSEIGGFVARADALLVNLGTFDAERQKASLRAIAAAGKARIPWLLDPVFIDRSRPRAAFAKRLAAKKPSAIRLNAAEFGALSGGLSDVPSLIRYAAGKRTVIGLTGATDLVQDGRRLATIANGHPLMTQVTAMGCAGSALVAACLAVESDPWRATVAALLAFGVAGERAAAQAKGPGSFAVAFVDALHGLDRATLTGIARVT
jgi:hydroxyethylthiazole kinase